ncbi:MAG TPA: heavy-metal-associated domain-containing protein [Trebonia sp.]|nr:heavy-metal-associated domain-containing protein [Trebonia sp.]
MTSAIYHVAGMTCEHCARAVTVELEALDGVSDVTVDLVPGGATAVTVVSTAPLRLSDVEAALDEAGDYRITEPAGGPAVADDRARLPILD